MSAAVRYISIAMCIVTCSLHVVYAQQPAPAHSVTDTSGTALPGVTVRPKRGGILLSSPTPAQVLGGADLERMNSLSVADAVRFFSGVQLKDYGGIGGLKTINVRSMGTNHTGVFYDNIQLGNAQNGQVDLGKFSLDNVEEIALYNGDRGTLLQTAKSYASASGIYLQTRTPVFTGTKKTNIRAGIKGGSFGLVNPSLLIEQKLSSTLNTTFSGEWNHANGDYKFRYNKNAYDSVFHRKNGDITALRLEGGLNKSLPDSGFLKLKAYYYRSDRGLPNAIVANRYGPLQPDSGQRLYDRNFFVQTSFHKKYGDYSLEANAKYARDYNRYIDPEIVVQSGHALENIYKQQELYVSLANSFQLTTAWSVALNADLQRNSMDANLYRFPYPTRYTLLAVAASQYYTPRLSIQGSLLSTTVNDEVKQYAGAGKKQEFSPALSASLQPFDYPGFRIRAFYKDIFRMPTFNDLYYTTIGNVFLKPEYTKQFDLGFTGSREWEGPIPFISFQADGYYNKVKDKILAVPSSNPFIWSMKNLSRVTIKGIDVVLKTAMKLSPGTSLTVGINYTYQQATDKTPQTANSGYNYGSQIPYTPWHNGSLIAGANICRFQLNYSFIYTGERYSQAANIPENYLQPWYTHDLSVSRTFKGAKLNYKLTAEVNNVFNQYYDVVVNFPMPGRNYRFGISVTY